MDEVDISINHSSSNINNNKRFFIDEEVKDNTNKPLI